MTNIRNLEEMCVAKAKHNSKMQNNGIIYEISFYVYNMHSSWKRQTKNEYNAEHQNQIVLYFASVPSKSD